MHGAPTHPVIDNEMTLYGRQMTDTKTIVVGRERVMATGTGKGLSSRPDDVSVLTLDELRTVPGMARDDRPAPCPVCGRPIGANQEVVTSLGDVRRGAVGMTVHARCFDAIGKAGLLQLMIDAYTHTRARQS